MSDVKFEHWAIVEVMGHSRYAGFVTEQAIGGSSFTRVDVPEVEGFPAFTKLFGQGSIFCITPVGEQEARNAAANFRSRPVDVYYVQPRAEPAAIGVDDDEDDDYRDDDLDGR